MASNILYPPILLDYLTAISGDSITIPVEFSDFNTIADIEPSLTQVRITNINNQSVLSTSHMNEIAIKTLVDNSITILSSDIQGGFAIDTVYKVQVRFTITGVTMPNGATGNWLSTNVDNFSEWSTICLIRLIPSSVIILPDAIASNIYTLNAALSFSAATTEKLNSYRLQVLNDENQVLEDTGYIRSARESLNIKYTFKTYFRNQHQYIIKCDYITSNGYEGVSTSGLITADITSWVGSSLLEINAENSEDICAIRVFMKDNNSTNSNSKKTYEVYRTSSKDNFTTVSRVLIINEYQLGETYWDDYSVEDNVSYKYILKQGDYIKESSVVLAYFEDMCLVSNNKIVRIKFNPTVSSLKYNVAESVTPTLGGVYPFVRRNGHQMYRTFSIGGLISYHAEEEAESVAWAPMSLFEGEDTIEKSPAIDEVAQERRFREEVMKFLYDNKVKLFKSATEGNILVKLTAITLTPEAQLGRRVYSFTATATEIAEDSYENYLKLGVFKENGEGITYYLLNAQSYSDGVAQVSSNQVDEDTLLVNTVTVI